MTEPIVIEPDSNQLMTPSLHPMARRRHRNNLKLSQFESESEESEHTVRKRKKPDKYPEKRKRRKTTNKKPKKNIDRFRLCPLRGSHVSLLHSRLSLVSLFPAYKDPNQAPLLPFQESVSQEEKLSEYQFLLENLDQQISVLSDQQQQQKSNHNDQDINLNTLVIISSENDSRTVKSKIRKKKKKKKKFERIRRVPIRKPTTDCHQILESKRMKILNQLSEQENVIEIVPQEKKIPSQGQSYSEITRQVQGQKSWEWKKQTIQFKSRSQNKSLLGSINS